MLFFGYSTVVCLFTESKIAVGDIFGYHENGKVGWAQVPSYVRKVGSSHVVQAIKLEILIVREPEVRTVVWLRSLNWEF
jgi:hypothetical protein